jgi:hypothetical protein
MKKMQTKSYWSSLYLACWTWITLGSIELRGQQQGVEGLQFESSFPSDCKFLGEFNGNFACLQMLDPDKYFQVSDNDSKVFSTSLMSLREDETLLFNRPSDGFLAVMDFEPTPDTFPSALKFKDPRDVPLLGSAWAKTKSINKGAEISEMRKGRDGDFVFVDSVSEDNQMILFYIKPKIIKPTGQELEAVNLFALIYEHSHLSFDLNTGEVTQKEVTPLGESTDQIKKLPISGNPLLEKIVIEYKQKD